MKQSQTEPGAHGVLPLWHDQCWSTITMNLQYEYHDLEHGLSNSAKQLLQWFQYISMTSTYYHLLIQFPISETVVFSQMKSSFQASSVTKCKISSSATLSCYRRCWIKGISSIGPRQNIHGKQMGAINGATPIADIAGWFISWKTMENNGKPG